MANLMGFRRTNKMPKPKSHSIYDPLLNEVRKTSGIYVLDVEDKKRAYSLTATLRSVIRKRKYDDIIVGVVDTTVYVKKEERKKDA